jgi:hypothetical protein
VSLLSDKLNDARVEYVSAWAALCAMKDYQMATSLGLQAQERFQVAKKIYYRIRKRHVMAEVSKALSYLNPRPADGAPS